MGRAEGRSFTRPAVRNRRFDRLAVLDPLEFERVVADYYRRQGCRVEHCGTGRGGRRFDGGIDLKLYRDGTYTIVQCKRENARQVTHNVGHELLGVMLTEKADRALVVNTGEFTPYAWESARKDPRLELIDGDRLREMLPEYAVVDANAAAGLNGKAPLDWPLSGPPSAPATGSVRYGRRSSRQRAENRNALIALGILVMLVAWQCSVRSDRERASAQSPQRQVQESRRAQPQGPVQGSPVQRPRRPETAGSGHPQVPTPTTAIDASEAKRRADAAMRVIEDTTPELKRRPDPHAVYQDNPH